MVEAVSTARLILAAVFVVAGLAKLRDPQGSRKSMQDFGAPGFLAAPLALVIPLAELTCAVALLFAGSVVWGAQGVAVLLAVFTVAIAVSLARGRKPNCHCFGQLSSSLVGWTTLARNAVLLALAVMVARAENPGEWPALSRGEMVEVVLAAALALTLWILFHMLQQNGRLLLRLEAVEKKLGIDPNAPEIPGVPVGDPAPPFRLAGLDGRTVTSEALLAQSKPVLLLFTEPGCRACATLHPEIAQWHDEHADRLSVVPISSGGLEANLSKNALPNLLLQAGRETSQAYKVTAAPSAVLIKDGKIASPLAAGADAIRDLVKRVTLPPSVKKGELVPALKLADLDGKTVDLASLRGRRRLVLFWNPGCGFCQKMLDDVKKWERQPHGADAPELLIISSGTPDANRQQGFRSPVLLDSIWGAGQVLGASGTPSAVLIDEEGKVASEVGVGAPAVMALAGADVLPRNGAT